MSSVVCCFSATPAFHKPFEGHDFGIPCAARGETGIWNQRRVQDELAVLDREYVVMPQVDKQSAEVIEAIVTKHGEVHIRRVIGGAFEMKEHHYRAAHIIGSLLYEPVHEYVVGRPGVQCFNHFLMLRD